MSDEPARFKSPSIEVILAWRDKIAAKYRDQLEEELTWDESSTFETSEDVATSGDVLFHYAAAVLDQRGASELRKLADVTEPPREEYEAAFAEADRRSFSGRFPQLLLGAEVWLPYKKNLMIEEPNWDDRLDRYGSVVRLIEEVTAVRAAIAEAQPSVVRSSDFRTSDKMLNAAWHTSSIILRIAAIAAARHLPLWTTG